jgi:hypothetical protein
MRGRLAIRTLLVASVLFATLAIWSDASRAATATTTEGCINQWMFNGVWRVQVTKVEPNMDGNTQIGWQVTQVWRNGTSQNGLSPSDTFLKAEVLVLASGKTISASDSTGGSLSLNGLVYHNYPVAGANTNVVIFRPAAGTLDAADVPKALDITFDAQKLSQVKSKPQFTTHQPDYHIKLDCTASGAQAAAQGGAQEVAAQAGCLNQWMANGLWRMRATAIAPDMNGNQQIGWAITQQWVNQTNKPLAPGDSNVLDEQLVFKSGNTVSSTNSAGSSMSQSKRDNTTIASGDTLTYQQLFRPGNLDPADTPVKLLILFDAKKQNTRTNAPHYTGNPADYRIQLDCTK